MGNELGSEYLQQLLRVLGDRLQTPSTLLLLGGGGLSLLGSPRSTLDLDYNGDENTRSELRRVLEQIADEMHVDVEAVPLHQFIPLPPGAEQRHIPIGVYGNLRVLVFDPYSIALSKLDRGFDADIEDVVFLFRRGYVLPDILESMLAQTNESAMKLDLDMAAMNGRFRLALEISGSGQDSRRKQD